MAPEARAAWQLRRTLSARLSFSQPPPPSLQFMRTLRSRMRDSTHSSSTTEGAPEGAPASAKPEEESPESVHTTEEERRADAEAGEQLPGVDMDIVTDPLAMPPPTNDAAVDVSEVQVELDADGRSEQRRADEEDTGPSSSRPRRLSLDDSSELGAASVGP